MKCKLWSPPNQWIKQMESQKNLQYWDYTVVWILLSASGFPVQTSEKEAKILFSLSTFHFWGKKLNDCLKKNYAKTVSKQTKKTTIFLFFYLPTMILTMLR